MNILKITLAFLFPTILLAAPNRPSSVTFTNVSDRSVTIHWQDNSYNESGFKIYRNDVLIAITAKNSTSFTDLRLNPNSDYTYIVKATDDNMNGDISERIIGQKIADQGATIGAFVYTPQRGGAIVLESKGYSQELYLYGLENPNNPLKEYRIYDVSTEYSIYDVRMLGNGKISFKVGNDSTGVKYEVTYNYINKREISRRDIASSEFSLKEKIKKAMGLGEMSSVRSMTYSPQRGGLIASVVTDQGSYLALFGLEDPDNPVFEYDIEIDDMGHKSYKDIKMLGGGIFQYTTYSYKDRSYVLMTYDYFNKRVVKREITDTTKDVRDKIDSYLDDKYIHKNSGYNIARLEYLESDLYLLTVNYWSPADDYQRTSVIRVTDIVTEQKSLAHIKYGPGGHEAKNIIIDAEANLITYNTDVKWHDLDYDTNIDLVNDYINNYVWLNRYDYYADILTKEMIQK